MNVPQQRKNVFNAPQILLVLLGVVICATVCFSQECKSNQVLIHFTNLNWTVGYKNSTSNETVTLKNQLFQATGRLENETGFCNATIIDISKGSVLVRLAIFYSSNFSDLVNILDNALMETFPNSTNIASRFFTAQVNITSSDTSEQLLMAVNTLLQGVPGFVIVQVNGVNGSVVFLSIGMAQSASSYPSKALSALVLAASNGSINSVPVDASSFRLYIESPKPTLHEFEVSFDVSVESCFNVSDTTSSAHSYLIGNVSARLDKIKQNIANFSYKVTLKKCSSSMVRALSSSAVVEVHAIVYTAPEFMDPSKLAELLLDCTMVQQEGRSVNVELLTPTMAMEARSSQVCPTSSPTPSTATPTKGTGGTNAPITATTPMPPAGQTPRLFVRLRLALTWSQFCGKLEDSLRQQIARNVYDKQGKMISPERIVYINSVRDCADHTKAQEQVDLWLYVRNKTHPERPSRCVTLKTYRVLKMLVDNGNTQMLGDDFKGRVIGADLAGCDSKQFMKTSQMPDWTLIIILIAVGVGAILLFLACCCICCGAARRRRRRRHKEKYGNVELVVVEGEDGKEKRAKKGKHKKKKKGKKNKDDGSDGEENKRAKQKGKGADDGKKGTNGGKDSKGKADDGKGKAGVGQENEAYDNKCEDMNANKDKTDKGKASAEDAKSYDNSTYGLGDRKPSATYAEIGSNSGKNTYANLSPHGKGTGTGGDDDYEVMIAGAAGAAVAGGVTGAAAASARGKNTNKSAPAIVTSPAPGGSASDTGKLSTSSSPGSRRGSATLGGGSPSGVRRGSATLGDVDDENLRDRRRSSIQFLAEEAEPLKHKTATVGIVGLALRNKNEKKKETEFKNLDKDMPGADEYPVNTASKNRNPDILPHPRTRFKLSKSPDYINANYLFDHKGQRRYIATQHPLRETQADFWQMVWESGSCHLVMVNDDENNKEGDYPQYWPGAEGVSTEYGPITVTTKQITAKADFTITNLLITNTKISPPSSRDVTHYRFTSWKDKTTPNVALFVSFVVASREISKKYEEGKDCPVIVHCSDGQGFTGVFVAVDIGVRSHEESKTSVVDVFEVAKRLRQCRCGIIRSLQHYNFTYQCLYEYTVNYDEEAEKKKE